jgi:hypothetical protein
VSLHALESYYVDVEHSMSVHHPQVFDIDYQCFIFATEGVFGHMKYEVGQPRCHYCIHEPCMKSPNGEMSLVQLYGALE